MAAKKLNMIYVGGIDDSVTEEVLHAAFIPFGELKSIQIPRDYKENKTRGFAFVEFDLDEDAAAAIDNMDGSELYGKVIRCNIARTMPKLAPGKAIWSTEEWIQSSLNEGETIEMGGEVVEPLNLEPTTE